MLKYLFFVLLSFTFTRKTNAQSHAEFEAFAREAVAFLSDSSYHPGIELIRINLLLELIDEQPIGAKEKELEKVKANKYFKQDYQHFKRQMASIRTEYLNYIKGGATLEFYDYQQEPIPGRDRMYTYRVRFILHKGELQNLVSLTFNAAYVLNHLVLLEPFSEEF